MYKKSKSPRQPRPAASKPALPAVPPPKEVPAVAHVRVRGGRRMALIVAGLVVLAALAWAGWQWAGGRPGGNAVQAPAPARYVGVQACAGCHAQAYAALHGSQH